MGTSAAKIVCRSILPGMSTHNDISAGELAFARRVADVLGTLPGVLAVALGGSRGGRHAPA
jgi:hypothetical protein